MAISEEACERVAQGLRKRCPKVLFETCEYFDAPGDFYIRVVSPEYETPDLQTLLPAGWEASDWMNPDQRAMTCVVMFRSGA